MRKVITLRKKETPKALEQYIVAKTEKHNYLITPDIDTNTSIPIARYRMIMNKAEYDNTPTWKVLNAIMLAKTEEDYQNNNQNYIVHLDPQYK